MFIRQVFKDIKNYLRENPRIFTKEYSAWDGEHYVTLVDLSITMRVDKFSTIFLSGASNLRANIIESIYLWDLLRLKNKIWKKLRTINKYATNEVL